MWVFLIVFLLSRYFSLRDKLKQLMNGQNSDDQSPARVDIGDKRSEVDDFETQELKRLKIEEQKIKNVIAAEQLAMDREKRLQAKKIHEIELQKIVKDFPKELKEPQAWFG